MFTDDEQTYLAGLTRSVPREVILDALLHRSGAVAPVTGDGAALAKVEGAAEALNNFQQDRPWLALSWARKFALRFAGEVRATICGTGAADAAKAVGLTATGVATALAGWLAGLVGLTGPIALGIAGLIVLAMGRAVIGSICEMTAAGLAEALGSSH